VGRGWAARGSRGWPWWRRAAGSRPAAACARRSAGIRGHRLRRRAARDRPRPVVEAAAPDRRRRAAAPGDQPAQGSLGCRLGLVGCSDQESNPALSPRLPSCSLARQGARRPAFVAADEPAPLRSPSPARRGRARQHTGPGPRGSARGGSGAEEPGP
jgi:hypothetical protein